MHSVVGVFSSRAAADHAVEELKRTGIAISRIHLLTPGASEAEMGAVPVTETEQPGMGKTVGGLIGGALGAAGGIQLGTAAATALLPGVGPVLVLSTAAATLLGAGGIVGGAAAGQALENLTMEGLPKDELFVYADALGHGRSIVLVFAEDAQAAGDARRILMRAGAESLDAARDTWWLGVRSAEEEQYVAAGHDFQADEATFRRGFEAALQPRARGKTYAEVAEELRQGYPEVYAEEAFRRGFERGRAYSWIVRDGRRSS